MTYLLIIYMLRRVLSPVLSEKMLDFAMTKQKILNRELRTWT